MDIDVVSNQPGVLAAFVPGVYTPYDFVPPWFPIETAIDAYDCQYANANIALSRAMPATQDKNQYDKTSDYQLNMDDTPPDPILELLDF